MFHGSGAKSDRHALIKEEKTGVEEKNKGLYWLACRCRSPLEKMSSLEIVAAQVVQAAAVAAEA